MHLKKIIAIGLVFAGLSISATSFADILPIEPFCTVECNHPDLTKFDKYEISDLKGAVKQVSIYPNVGTYSVSKNGLITKLAHADGRSITYEYDNLNRIQFVRMFDEKRKPNGKDEYSYIDAKHMVIVKRYRYGKWLNTSAIVSSTENDGKLLYFEMNVEPDKYLNFGRKFVLSLDRSKWNETFLSQIDMHGFKENDAEVILLAQLNCLQGNVCANGWKIGRSEDTVTKSKDGEFDKFTFQNCCASWFKNGLIDEDTGTYEAIADGTKPHGIYKYQFDPKGNWIKREKYINDIPATLTDDKPKYRKVDEETLIRKIEYYD